MFSRLLWNAFSWYSIFCKARRTWTSQRQQQQQQQEQYVTWSWPTFDLWLFRAETLHLSRSFGVGVGNGDTSTDLENVLAEPKTPSQSQFQSQYQSRSQSQSQSTVSQVATRSTHSELPPPSQLPAYKHFVKGAIHIFSVRFHFSVAFSLPVLCFTFICMALLMMRCAIMTHACQIRGDQVGCIYVYAHKNQTQCPNAYG